MSDCVGGVVFFCLTGRTPDESRIEIGKPEFVKKINIHYACFQNHAEGLFR